MIKIICNIYVQTKEKNSRQIVVNNLATFIVQKNILMAYFPMGTGLLSSILAQANIRLLAILNQYDFRMTFPKTIHFNLLNIKYLMVTNVKY